MYGPVSGSSAWTLSAAAEPAMSIGPKTRGVPHSIPSHHVDLGSQREQAEWNRLFPLV